MASEKVNFTFPINTCYCRASVLVLTPQQTISKTNNWKIDSNTDFTAANTSIGMETESGAAIKNDGTLWVWGSNLCGRLGINASFSLFRSSPVQTVSQGTNWSQVSLGRYQTAAIKTDGTLWLWGMSNEGKMGNNSTIDRSSPVQTISQGTNWKQVSVGCRHVGAIKTDGRLWLWGNAACGQLGNSESLLGVNRSSPVQTISQGTNWKQVSVSSDFSTAVKTDGTLWTWGYNNSGQLGNYSRVSQSSPVQTISQTTNWKQVAAGSDATAAIKTDGTLWLWGTGSSGILGNNATPSQSSPVQTVSTGTTWSQVSLTRMGGSVTSAAIKTDGTLWLWGDAGNGQLGNNSLIDRSSPVQTFTSGTNWSHVCLSRRFAAATKTDGTLWTWGCGNCGELGNGFGVTSATTTKVDFDDMFVRRDIFSEGGLWLWGYNSPGNLGNSSTLDLSSPVQTVSTGTNWKKISAGRNAAGIKSDGTLWIWGSNGCGQLGNNSTGAGHSSPVQTVSTGTNWKIASSGNATFAAIKSDGTLWLWGYNLGRLGNNSTTSQSSPVQTVSTGTNWKQVGVAAAHTLALKIDGTLWTWGAGGRLGTNDLTSQSSPVQTVSTGTDWKQIATNIFLSSDSAAIKTDGTLWIWGNGQFGRLGNNSELNRSSPVQTISTGTNWKQVNLGNYHSGSLKTDGTLWVWGRNLRGQLGNNSGVYSSSPVQTVSQGNNWREMASGSSFSLAIREDCW